MRKQKKREELIEKIVKWIRNNDEWKKLAKEISITPPPNSKPANKILYEMRYGK
jgi:hypothetical protein